MIAILRPAARLADKLGEVYWAVAAQEPEYRVAQALFRDSLSLWPEQCELAMNSLIALRTTTMLIRDALGDLDPEQSRGVGAQATMTKLEELEEQLTEALLYIAMFAQVCQHIASERVELHQLIRSLLKTTSSVLQDTLRQLAAMAERAMFLPALEGHDA